MREANCKMITRKQKDSSGGAPQPRGCAFGWNQEKECWETSRTSPDDEEKNEIDNRSGEISQKKRQTERVLRERRREWFGVETKSQKGGYQSTVKNATTSCKSTWDTVPYFGFLLVIPSPLLIKVASNFDFSKLGGREEGGKFTSHRPAIWSKKGRFSSECLAIFPTGFLSPSYLYSRVVPNY